jgi:hypothetical protein
MDLNIYFLNLCHVQMMILFLNLSGFDFVCRVLIVELADLIESAMLLFPFVALTFVEPSLDFA